MEQYLKDKDFQSQRAEQCDLLIELSSTHISYAIVDHVYDQLHILFSTSLTSHTDEIQMLDKLLDTHPELRFPFRKTKISVQTSQFTFIPNELFDQSLVEEYAKFIQPSTQTDFGIQISDIKSADIKNILTIDLGLQKALQTRFSQAQLFSQAEPFIAGMNKMIDERGGIALGLNIHSETFEAVLFGSGKLIFYNLFDCINADEFNYFLLNIVKELDLDPTQIKIFLAGTTDKNDAYHQRIQKYFPHIHFLNTRQLLVQSDLTDQLVPHLFFSLISLDLCE